MSPATSAFGTDTLVASQQTDLIVDAGASVSCVAFNDDGRTDTVNLDCNFFGRLIDAQ